MPTYVYRCEACGLTFERRQKISDAPLTECPECGGQVRRVIQPVPIIFKGPGFYVTDNKGVGPTAPVPDNGRDAEKKTAQESKASKEKTSASDG